MDVFSKAKQSELMSRVSGHRNKASEVVLVIRLSRHRINDWLRHVEIRNAEQ